DPAPWMDWSRRDLELQHDVLTELALAYMDALGISGALLFSEDWGATAAREHPDRMAHVPHISPDVDDIDAAVADAKPRRAQGRLALRATIGWPLDGKEVARFERGEWDPVFGACEHHGVPLFFFVTRHLPFAEDVATRYPDLQLIIDHVGLPQPPM